MGNRVWVKICLQEKGVAVKAVASFFIGRPWEKIKLKLRSAKRYPGEDFTPGIHKNF